METIRYRASKESSAGVVASAPNRSTKADATDTATAAASVIRRRLVKLLHRRVAALLGAAILLPDSSSHTECCGLDIACVGAWIRAGPASRAAA